MHILRAEDDDPTAAFVEHGLLGLFAAAHDGEVTIGDARSGSCVTIVPSSSAR